MGRPASYFETRAFSAAKSAAKKRGHRLWKFVRATKEGSETGFYVGPRIPQRLARARVAPMKV